MLSCVNNIIKNIIPDSFWTLRIWDLKKLYNCTAMLIIPMSLVEFRPLMNKFCSGAHFSRWGLGLLWIIFSLTISWVGEDLGTISEKNVSYSDNSRSNRYFSLCQWLMRNSRVICFNKRMKVREVSDQVSIMGVQILIRSISKIFPYKIL